MRRLIRIFQAKRENGQSEVLCIYEDVQKVSDLQSAELVGGGPLILQTEGGKTVRRIEKGKYEVLANPTYHLTSNDPNAI